MECGAIRFHKVNLVADEKNGVLATKVDEVICMIKDNEGKFISDFKVEHVGFISRDNS
jgi:hypothetical protein